MKKRILCIPGDSFFIFKIRKIIKVQKSLQCGKMYLEEHFPTFLDPNYCYLLNNVKKLKELRGPETTDNI